MLTVALTGGIGSGKTAVTELFQKFGHEQGLKIIDSDVIARNLLSGTLENSPSEALHTVYDTFGPELFEKTPEAHWQLNRSKMRALIFSSESRKKQLESLLHPLVYKEIFSQIENLKNALPPARIVIIAIPLLFETGYENRFDRVLVIDVPEAIQIERTLKRDHCSRDLIEQIIKSQVDRHIRLEKADDVIDNSGSYDQLSEQVDSLYQFYDSIN